jgi:hypothetical protein
MLDKKISAFPARTRSKGQALLEYVLLIAGLSVASFAFLKFFNSELFGAGMGRLPNKVSVCASHIPDPSVKCGP